MTNDPTIKIPMAIAKKHFFYCQGVHIFLLAVLVTIALELATTTLKLSGDYLGLSKVEWFYLALIIPAVHQISVWIIWRGQLTFQILTKIFGKADWLAWGIWFFPFLIARPILLVAIGLADFGTMAIPRVVSLSFGLLLLPPALYTFYCVKKYFGIKRALGGDHFRESYRKMPLIKKGAFTWSSNAMYTFGFLFLISIAFLTHSTAALVASLFQYAYIWVHYLCTEEPDMKLIYRS